MTSIDIFKKEVFPLLRCDPLPLNFLLFNLFKMFCNLSRVDKGFGGERKEGGFNSAEDDEEGIAEAQIVVINAIKWMG